MTCKRIKAMSEAPETARSRRDQIGISHADERRIAAELSPSVAWPTLALAVVLPTTLLSFIGLGLRGDVPLWTCTLVLTFVSYGHYTLVHEAVHGNLITRPKSLTWINTLVGWIGALGMGGGWPALQRTHVLHHSHTNTALDPDIAVKGTLFQLLRKWLMGLPTALIPMVLVRFISPERYKRLGKILSPSEIAQVSAVTVFTLALLVLSLATGRFADWLMLWFLPTRLGVLILNIFFQWLPHHPFDQTERYLNTRISLWPGGTFLTLQQNLHLVHHLWPSVPFYNYARLFRALRPVLIAEGSPIEGLLVGPARRNLA